MSNFPYTPPTPTQLRPVNSATVATTTAAGSAFLDKIAAENDKLVKYFKDLIQNVDQQALIVGVSVVTTLGLGGAAAWYFHNKRSQSIKKSNKVGFEESVSPMKTDSGRTLNAEEGDTIQPGVLFLHQCPRGRRTPCIAPYPLKLETFLRVNGISYEVSWK